MKGGGNMNGKITIDGYCRKQGHYEIVVHGGEQDQEALCSLTMKINRNEDIEELLKLMLGHVQRYAEMERR